MEEAVVRRGVERAWLGPVGGEDDGKRALRIGQAVRDRLPRRAVRLPVYRGLRAREIVRMPRAVRGGNDVRGWVAGIDGEAPRVMMLHPRVITPPCRTTVRALGVATARRLIDASRRGGVG